MGLLSNLRNRSQAIIPFARFYSAKVIHFLERLVGYLLYRLQWIPVLFFVLPLSLFSRQWRRSRYWLFTRLGVSERVHDRRVAAIQRQVRMWNKEGRKQRLCTARSSYEALSMSWRRPRYKAFLQGIDTHKLRDVLQLNSEQRWVRVGAAVTIGQLVDYLLRLGFTLPIVPPLEEFTVGGLINGNGVGASGRKYGLFQHICLQYEMVTSQGELIVSKKEAKSEHQSLFYGIPWSHGSLGLLVAVTLRIIPSQPLVKLLYQPCFSQNELFTRLRDEATARNGNEFIEAIQLRPDAGVVVTGQFAEQVPKNAERNAIGAWWKPSFYKHVEGIFEAADAVRSSRQRNGVQPSVEYVPTRDFYFRHERSFVWKAKEWLPFADYWWFRYPLGWTLPPKLALIKMCTFRPLKNFYDASFVSQDLMVPATSLEDTLTLLDKELQIYPLLLTPFNLPSQPGLLRNRSGLNNLYVDVGVYGRSPLATSGSYRPFETGRRVEKFLRSMQGVQLLYADCYQTCSEFWEMFDASLYDWLRAKYDCKAAFPSVYEKVARPARE